MARPRPRPNPQASIFELIRLTHRFVRNELVHSGVGIIVFSVIFLIFKPWNKKNHYYNEETDTNPFWFVAPPLIYFILDFFCGIYLHFALRNELRPRPCLFWVSCQIANLILLTFTGFAMVWNYYYRGNTWLRLILALIIMYCYKSYRISKMHKLIDEMRARCDMPIRVTPGVTAGVPVVVQTASSEPEKMPYMIAVHSIGEPTNSTC